MREWSWNSFPGDLIHSGMWNTFKAEWTEQPTNFPWPFQKPASPVFQARRIHSMCWGTTFIHSRVEWVLAPGQRQCSAPAPGIRALSGDKELWYLTTFRGAENHSHHLRVWNAEMTYCFVWNLERQSASFNKLVGRSKIFLRSEEWHQSVLQKDTSLFSYSEGNVKSPWFNSYNSHYKKKRIFSVLH